jgi:hypothetical protein
MVISEGNAYYNSVHDISSCRLSPKIKKKIKICETIVLPAVLYGCETSPLMLKKEHILKVFRNKVLRRMYGPKMDGMVRG